VLVNLGYPLNNSVNQSNTINFNWQSPVVNAERYYLKISDDSLQNNLIYFDSVDNITNKTVGPLELNKKFYWSVSFRDTFDYEVSSEIRNFRTGILTVNLFTPINNANRHKIVAFVFLSPSSKDRLLSLVNVFKSNISK